MKLDMDLRVTHPTKEQVRAYMLSREGAHRPPPAPEDIRRQLGWRLASAEPHFALIRLCLLPVAFGQFATQAALAWFLTPIGLTIRTRSARENRSLH
jgi:hypothetical protein